MNTTLSRPKFDDVSNKGYQHCTRKRTYTQSDEEQHHNPYKKFRRTSPISPTPSSTINDEIGISSGSIFPWEDDSKSKPRIIDLSTGEILEPFPFAKQKGRKKFDRFLDVEKNEGNPILCEYIQNADGLKNLDNYAVNNDKVEVENPGSIADIIQELKAVHTADTQFTSTSKIVQTITAINAVIQPSQSLSMVVNSKNIKLEFADQCQQALNRYMRSQIDHVDDGSCGIYGKEMVLYRPNQEGYVNSSSDNPKIEEIIDTNDIEGKIIEINEDDIEMCDVEADTSEAIMEIEQFIDQEVDRIDEMDID